MRRSRLERSQGVLDNDLTIWDSISTTRRNLVLSALILGFSLFVLVDVFYRIQYLAHGWGGDGILYLPLDLSAVGFASLVIFSVLSVILSSGPKNADPVALRLGAAWLLVSIPLVFDFLVDSFEARLPVVLLFIIVGIRYWKGHRKSYLSLILSPLVVFVAAADGLGHLQGNFCPPPGIDACSSKAVSDTYLVMVLLLLTFITIAGRSKRPGLVPLLIAVLLAALAVAGLALFA